MDKLVSVIMPVYNVEKYIGKSVQSVLNQTYQNFELLIIDDGTPDNSIKVVEQIKDERIRIFHKSNGGLSDARNFGLDQARGNYVYFIDSDDWIEPTLLEDSTIIMEAECLDLMIFGYVQDNEDAEGNLIRSKTFLPRDMTFVKDVRNPEIDELHLNLLGYAWNKMYRKSFLDKHMLRFEKGTSLVEDILFNSIAYIKTEKIRFVDKALYHYSVRPVETLIKAFHENLFELKVKKTKSLELFLDAWNMNEKNKNKILSLSMMLGIRYCVHNLFTFKNNLSVSKKVRYIKKMVNHPMTLKFIDYYETKSFKDKVYKKLIKNKSSVLISFMAYTTK